MSQTMVTYYFETVEKDGVMVQELRTGFISTKDLRMPIDREFELESMHES